MVGNKTRVFIQPHASRRDKRDSKEMSYRVSDLSNSDLYVLLPTGRSTGRLVRLYNTNDMYREIRTKRYDSYSEESDYSSEFSSEETESEYYESPRQIRLVPEKRNLNQSDRNITSRIIRHTSGNKNLNYRYSTSTPSSGRIVYPRTKYVSRTQPYSESNSNSINSRKKLKLVKVVPVQDTYYPEKQTRSRTIRYVGDDRDKVCEVRVARKVLDSARPLPEHPVIYRQSVPDKNLKYTGEFPTAMQETGHAAKHSPRSDSGFREIPLPVKYSESKEIHERDGSFKPREVSKANVRKIQREEVHVHSENKQASLNTYRSSSTEKQHVIPVKQYNVPIKQKPVLSKQSYSSSDKSSESDDTEYSDSDSDSESTLTSTQNEAKTLDPNQTSRLLLDYSKMLKSREEQRRYEKERKQHEHETNIVTCVQREINKPVKTVCKFDHKIESTNSSTSKFSKESYTDSQPPEREPKPLPSNSKVRDILEDQEQIKTIVRIDERRRRKMEERNRLVAWTESENKNEKYNLQLENVKKGPTVYDFDTCRHSTPTENNRQDEPDNIEVRLNYEDDFDKLYPKPRNKGVQLVYNIDLTKPPEIIEPKPFDVDKRRIVLQPKKKHEGPLVKVGGGWNTLDNYMERHIPVKRFVYPRSPDSKSKYYGFQSNYKSPRSNLIYRPL